MNKFEEVAKAKGLDALDIKNAIIANLWIFAWAVTLGVILSLSDYGWYKSTWIIILGLCVHMGVSIGMVLAFKRFLIEADELERKIQLDAMALSVGITILFSGHSIL